MHYKNLMFTFPDLLGTATWYPRWSSTTHIKHPSPKTPQHFTPLYPRKTREWCTHRSCRPRAPRSPRSWPRRATTSSCGCCGSRSWSSWPSSSCGSTWGAGSAHPRREGRERRVSAGGRGPRRVAGIGEGRTPKDHAKGVENWFLGENEYDFKLN